MPVEGSQLSWGKEAQLLRKRTIKQQRKIRALLDQRDKKSKALRKRLIRGMYSFSLTEKELQKYLAKKSKPRILVTGSRTWTDRKSIEASLEKALKFIGKSAEDATLIHGAARGADLLCASIARELGMKLEAHPADWSTHSANCPKSAPKNGSCWQGRPSCKRAGFRRNKEMIDSGAAILIALIRDESAGASGTLDLWLKEDRPVIICRQDGDGKVRGQLLNMDYWEKPKDSSESSESSKDSESSQALTPSSSIETPRASDASSDSHMLGFANASQDSNSADYSKEDPSSEEGSSAEKRSTFI